MPSNTARLPADAAERPSEAAFRALARVFGLLRRAHQPYFAGFGISLSQWGVLRALHCAEAGGEKGVRLTDLGDRLLIRPPSVTGVVDRLQRQGLVARASMPGDQRARHVSLTAPGRVLVDRVEEGHRARVTRVLEALSLAEQKEFRHLLDKLGAHLEGIVDREVAGVPGDNPRKSTNGRRKRGPES